MRRPRRRLSPFAFVSCAASELLGRVVHGASLVCHCLLSSPPPPPSSTTRCVHGATLVRHIVCFRLLHHLLAPRRDVYTARPSFATLFAFVSSATSELHDAMCIWREPRLPHCFLAFPARPSPAARLMYGATVNAVWSVSRSMES